MANDRFDPDILLEHGDFVRALVRSLLADPDLANDVEQQTWLAAMRHPPSVGTSARAYLAVIAKNFARRLQRDDSRRQRALEQLGSEPSSAPSREEILAIEEQRRRVIEAVLDLDEKYRTVVVLRYLEELSPRAISERIGVPVDSVKTRLKRALTQLRARFDTEAATEGTPWRIALLPLARLSTGHGLAVPVGGLGALAGVFVMKPIALFGVVLTLAVGSLWWWNRDTPREAPPLAAHVDSETSAPEIVAAAPADPIERNASPGAEPAVRPDPTTPSSSERRIRGHVVFEDGSPAVGATVEARSTVGEEGAALVGPRGVGELLGSTASDARGEFTIAVGSANRIDLLATHPTRSFAVASGVALDDEPELVLERYAELRGHVRRKADGAPVSNATLRVFRAKESWRERTLQPALDGTYAFTDLVPGHFSVSVESTEYADPDWENVEVAPGQVLQLDFDLLDGVVVRGRVTDATTHEPIAGAEVSAGWTFRSTVTTDAEGRYEYRGFGDVGIHDLHCRARGYGRTETARLSVSAREPERSIDFSLTRAHRARGVLVDRTGTPIAGARVFGFASEFVQVPGSESNVGSMKQLFDLQSTTSGADGSFLLEDLRPDARHALYIEPRSHAIVVYDFPSDELARDEVDFGSLTIASSQRIQGFLTRSNSIPIGRGRVTLRGTNEDRLRFSGDATAVSRGFVDERSTITSSAGEFSFDRVAPGNYQLAYARDAGAVEITTTVVVIDGEDLLGTMLVVPADHTIRGRIECEGGTLPKLANISAIQSDDVFGQDTATLMRPDGTFELILPSAASCGIRVTAVRRSPDEPRFEPAWVENVATGRDDLVIKLTLAATISGVVHDSEGKPMTAGHIALRDAFGSIAAWTTPDEDGRFEIVVKRGAQGSVQARSLAKQDELLGDGDPSNDDTGWSDPIPAAAGQAGLEIKLPKAK